MHEETFRAAEDGATILTASGRLARVLARHFHSRQRALGRSVWEHADILPLDAFLERAWRDWLCRGTDPDAPVLLDRFQEQLVWEQIVRQSPQGETLLQIPETARQAMEAWQLVQAYRLPLDGRFEATEDWAAFAAWSRAFRERCRASRWLERARLADFLRERYASGELPRPAAIVLAGFDDLTPQQAQFLEALGERRELASVETRSSRTLLKLPDSSAEIRAAAAWARRQLEGNPETQIGIVVPQLTVLRSKVERIFREGLDEAFHVSLGPPLSDYPLVRAALLALEFGLGRLALPRAGMLLRSPFLGGAEAEWNQRALLDATLRRKGLWDMGVSRLRDAAPSCPQLERRLHRFEQEIRKLPGEQSPSGWSRGFSQLLDALGWPGDRPLDSREFQIREAWHGLLSNLAALDLVVSLLSYDEALDRLHDLAASTVFQVENQAAPVQIMGALEASGLRFDHLWVMGLHDEALPSAAHPNPFLPISLQRDHKLPHSSAERELEFATKLAVRLLASAPDVALSYPETEGDRKLAPSPLVAGEWLSRSVDPGDTWTARMRAAAVFEDLADRAGPPWIDDAVQHGGARLFQDMAACPFRAFVKHRLAARPLEDTDPGLNYRDRGTSVHKALEFIWTEIGSHARLMALPPGELQALIARHVDRAVKTLGPGIGRNLERRRLERLLAEWLEIEKRRGKFQVGQSERDRIVDIAGLRVQTRADRIDQLPDGRQIILDYKTGMVDTSAWDGERPDQPQLPLYCATVGQPLAGAAFARIRTGELGFIGLTDQDATLPDMKLMKADQVVPFGEHVSAWRSALERLAEDFRAGRAEVDPKPDACENCGLRAVCRIREYENDRR